MRRALHILSVALITAGVVILVDVGMTLAWKEPLSTIYGSIQQARAAQQLDQLERNFPTLADFGPGAPRQLQRRAGRLADQFAAEVVAGEGIGRLLIPSIDVDQVVVEGTDTATLRNGPGRYPDTAFPGQGETIGIAGHRTTYLAPFHSINEIANGDEVVIEMPYATFTYETSGHKIVEPTEVQVVDDVGYERLVLTACHPLYSAAQRWVVFARLVEVAPA